MARLETLGNISLAILALIAGAAVLLCLYRRAVRRTRPERPAPPMPVWLGGEDDAVTCHSAGGLVIHASPAMARMLGTTPQALLGRGLFDRLHVQDRPLFLHALARALAGEKSVQLAFRVRREDKGFLGLDMRICLQIHDPTPFIVALSRETAQQEPEDRHPKAPAQMAEPRTDAGLAMAYVKKRPLRLRRMEMSRLLSHCHDIAHPLAQSIGVCLVTQIEPGLPEIVADFEACQQICLGLLAAALKSASTGETLRLSGHRKENFLVIVVRKTIPIVAFRPPQSGVLTSDLALSRMLAELQGGRLETDEAGNALASVYLPLASQDAPPLPSPSPEGPSELLLDTIKKDRRRA